MKPKMKSEVAVVFKDAVQHTVSFYSTPDALEDLASFGSINSSIYSSPDMHMLLIDWRYDFDEVVKYIEETYRSY